LNVDVKGILKIDHELTETERHMRVLFYAEPQAWSFEETQRRYKRPD
jgi:hypothetical protein